MNKKLSFKTLLIAFIVSLPIWWGLNIFAENLENTLFWQRVARDPEIFAAQMNQQILAEKINKIKSDFLQIRELDIGAKAAVSVAINSKGKEKLLFEKNSGQPLPIASLTKLMTALVVSGLDETFTPSVNVKITEKAVAQEGSSKYGDLKAGEEISAENLLHIMLIESSNDAAFALTEPIGEEGFIELMNLYVKDLGLKDTNFVNCTGLDPDDPAGPKNVSTAENIVKLSRYLFEKYPYIFEITKKYSYEALKPDGSIHHFIPQNTNELLKEFPEIIGGKTGWSPLAQGCLFLILKDPEKDNSYFINVVLGSEDRFEDMRKIIEIVNGIEG